MNLESEIETSGLPLTVLISIAPPSTSAELLTNSESVILMLPSQISIAPPYWALLLVNLEPVIVPAIALLVSVTSIAAPLLLFGVILPLPDAVFLSNTQSDTVKSDPHTKIPAPYNPPFSLKVEPDTVKVFTSSPASK